MRNDERIAREETVAKSTGVAKRRAAPALPPGKREAVTPPALVARRKASPSVIPFVRALRPKQWLKNLLVFAAPGAAGVLGQTAMLARTSAAFVAFCLISSGLYLINDVLDAPSDRLHPVKRNRPVAAGEMSPRSALFGAVVLVAAAEGLGFGLGYRFMLSLEVYLLLVLAYSLVLKRVLLIDLLAVASCFVIRAVAGGLATGIPDSEWFLVLVSTGALFVVTGKRYADLHTSKRSGTSSEAVLTASESERQVPLPRRKPNYRGSFLRVLALLLSAGSVTAYVLWVLSPHTREYGNLIPLSTVPFVMALGRYTYLIELKRGGAPEDLLTRDRPLQAAVLLWLVAYGSGIYLAT